MVSLHKSARQHSTAPKSTDRKNILFAFLAIGQGRRRPAFDRLECERENWSIFAVWGISPAFDDFGSLRLRALVCVSLPYDGKDCAPSAPTASRRGGRGFSPLFVPGGVPHARAVNLLYKPLRVQERLQRRHPNQVQPVLVEAVPTGQRVKAGGGAVRRRRRRNSHARHAVVLQVVSVLENGKTGNEKKKMVCLGECIPIYSWHCRAGILVRARNRARDTGQNENERKCN